MRSKKPKNIPRVIFWLLVFALCFGSVAFFYTKSQGIDQNRHALTLSVFSDIEQAEKLQTAVMVETRFGLLKSFDPLVEATNELLSLSNQLEGILSPIVLQSSTFANHWNIARASLEEKVRKVEHFKSLDASLENSNAYLPQVVEEVVELTEYIDEYHQIYEAAEDLGTSALKFAGDRSRRNQNDLSAVLKHLESLAASTPLPEEILIPVEEAIVHATLYYKLSLELDSILRGFQHETLHEALHQVKADYLAWYERKSGMADQYRSMSFLFSLLLVVVVLVQIYRLGLARSKESELFRQIGILAYEDNVTSLMNRNYFFEALGKSLKVGSSGAIVLMDINRFRNVNQALGQDIGDEVLRVVGTRLEALSSESQAISRLESNKFAILVEGIASVSVLTAHLAKVNKLIAEPVLIDQQFLDIEVTAVGALFPQISSDQKVLMRTLEDTLKQAKARKLQTAVAIKAAESFDTAQLSLYGELNAAIKLEQLFLMYQPKFGCSNTEIKSVEALVRWKHPERGVVPPGEFLPFAETTGLISKMTPWIIKQAAKDALKFHEKGQDIVFSVNISAIDLMSPFFVVKVQDILDEVGLPPHLLCFEVTESALMEDPDACLNRLHLLKDKGIRLSIDDYGTGLASLAYMRDLPVDELKIDRSFIAGVNIQERNAAIVQSTVQMCRDLGVQTVAEGVETQEEFEWLQGSGCELVQGFYLSRPLVFEQLKEKVSLTVFGETEVNLVG